MTKTNKIDKLLHDCYVELFANSNPPADFDVLVEQAKLNERGEKDIPFEEYSIMDYVLVDIVNKYADMVKPKWKRQMFVNTVYLGCSPKQINKNI